MTCPFQTELSIKSGDRLAVFGEPDVDGFYYAELEAGGRRGYVPADCVQPAATAAAGPTSTQRTGSRSASRPTAAPLSSSSAAAPGHHQPPPGHSTSSSAPPPSTRSHHHQDAAGAGSGPSSSHRSTSRRQPRDDVTELTAASGSRAAVTLPRSARDPQTGDVTGGGGRSGTTADSSTARHRRQ